MFKHAWRTLLHFLNLSLKYMYGLCVFIFSVGEMDQMLVLNKSVQVPSLITIYCITVVNYKTCHCYTTLNQFTQYQPQSSVCAGLLIIHYEYVWYTVLYIAASSRGLLRIYGNTQTKNSWNRFSCVSSSSSLWYNYCSLFIIKNYVKCLSPASTTTTEAPVPLYLVTYYHYSFILLYYIYF